MRWPPFRRWSGLVKEPFNAWTHAVGVFLAIAGGSWLVAASVGRPVALAAFIVYAVSSLALFAASTLLHAVPGSPAVVSRLRRADHAAIYVLIAGSYTPVTLITLRSSGSTWAWPLFTLVWTLAVAGVVFKLRWFDAPRWLSTGLYLALGWLAVLALGPIMAAMPSAGIVLLVLGGALYSIGAIVYARKRPDPLPNTVGYHGLWHLFVLAGWAAHFAMMAWWVLPT